MHDLIYFALLGLGTGALCALASQGLMVIYRGSGVLSFAHGAIGMVGAYVEWEVKVKHHQPTWLAWLVAIVICAALGAAAHLLIMKRLQRASPLARIVATLGMLIILQSVAVLRYGARNTLVQSEIPRKLIHIFGFYLQLFRRIQNSGVAGSESYGHTEREIGFFGCFCATKKYIYYKILRMSFVVLRADAEEIWHPRRG